MKRSDREGEGATSAPSFTAPVMQTINPLDVTGIEGLDDAEYEEEAEEDENGAEPADEDDDGERDEEKAPEEEDDPVPWLDHMYKKRVLSYEEWVAKCAHKDKNGRKFMVCHACQKALKCDNDSGLWNHNCCPAKVLNQWAKECRRRWPSSKRSRGSPTSKNAPQHVANADMVLEPEDVAKHFKMKDPKWESYKKEPPFYMTSHVQKMMAEEDEEEDTGPKTPKQRRMAKTSPEKKGKTKEERLAWFKSSHEEHMERFRQPETKQEESSEAPRQMQVPFSGARADPAASEKGRERKANRSKRKYS